MQQCVKPCFEVDCVDIKSEYVEFLKKLYNIMKKYKINRIYSASLDKKKVITAEQLLCSAVGNSSSCKFFNFLDKYIPWIYFNIFMRFHLFRYKIALKLLFNKYNIEKIQPSSFKLYQGIHANVNSLCVREIDIIFNDNKVFHINNLYLNI